jgi:hypothetical protein
VLLRKIVCILLLGMPVACGLVLSEGVAAASASRAIVNAISAQKSPDVPVNIKLERYKIVILSGRESLASAETAKPGDVLEDIATYSNKTSSVLVVPTATMPIPRNTELILNSVKPATAFASTDGINFFAMPLSVKLKQGNGVEFEQSVSLTQYRFLRWFPGAMAAKQSVVFSARFKVADGAEATIVKR